MSFFLLALVIFIGLIISLAIVIKMYSNYSTLATPSNIDNAKSVQRAVLEGKYTGVMMGRKGIQSSTPLPENQRLLINYSVIGARNLGYSGPQRDGVFDEDVATRMALTSGARLLILEIDRTEDNEPVLNYRDSQGYVQSMNKGSIQTVAKTLADRAWTATNDAVPSGLADDPLMLVLYFKNTPNNFSATSQYLTFLGKVAKELQPLQSRILGTTPQGDFRRQGLESQLFFMPLQLFMRKCIVLCNVDTSQFRSKEKYGMSSLKPEEDLDLMVHCRLYARESPSSLGATTSPSKSAVTPSAVITTPDYWLNTPPDRQREAVELTKQAFTIVMYNSSEKPIDKMTDLYDVYGVQAVPFSIFDNTDAWIGKDGHFQGNSWVVKKEILRFIPPEPIQVLKQNPKADSGQGFVVAPKL